MSATFVVLRKILLFERNNASAFVLSREGRAGINATNRKYTPVSVSEVTEAGWGSGKKECGLWSQNLAVLPRAGYPF